MTHYWTRDRDADDALRALLTERGIDERLTAIDPSGCGCTECLIGEYRPIDQASDEELRALFDGLLNDHADVFWSIDQKESWAGSGFSVWGDGRHVCDLDRLDFPLSVERYNLTLSHENVQRLLDGATTLD